MSEDTAKALLKHPFAVHAAQAAEDTISYDKQGFFTPDIYFTNDPKGLWAANNLRRYIVKMGYQAEIALDPVAIKGRVDSWVLLAVGQIPENFLDDIKNYMSIEEIATKTAAYCVQMNDNGQRKKTAETAMFHALQGIKSGQKPSPASN